MESQEITKKNTQFQLSTMFYCSIVSLLFQFCLLHIKSFSCCSLKDDELEHLMQVKEMYKDFDSDLSLIHEKKYLAEYCGCIVKDDLSEFCIKIIKQYHAQEKVSSTQDENPIVQFIMDVSNSLEPKSVFLLPQKRKHVSLQLIKNLSTYNLSSLLPENGFSFISGVIGKVK